MTRDDAIKAAGTEAVKSVESKNVDFTSRLTDGTEDMGYTEFSASIELEDESKLIMYVLIDSDDLDDVEDLGGLDWETAISHAKFEII